jgi:glutamine synthetase
LEELNLKAKSDRLSRVSADEIRDARLKYLTDEKRIKAVTVLFSDLEGRLHLLDYDKKFLINSYDNLTFDGSSIRGFTAQKESDLRLGIDWSAFYWVPADVFGTGKVLVFGTVIDKGGEPLLRRPARRAQALLGLALRGKGLHAQRGQRD